MCFSSALMWVAAFLLLHAYFASEPMHYLHGHIICINAASFFAFNN